MKKLYLILLISVCSLTTINAQFTKIGGGLTFGTGYHYNNEAGDFHRSPLLGIFATGIYELSLPVHISPSFSFFIPRHNTEFESESRVSSMMIDINGHYVFNSLDRFEFYGLAGLNIHFTSLKWIGTSSGDSDNTLGLNLGAGTYMKLTDQFDLFAEAKYILSKYGQFMVNAGVLINLQWLTKHENPDI